MGALNLENFKFVFDSYQSDIRFDLISDRPNKPSQYILKICDDKNRNIKFAYQAGDGLIRIDKLANKKKSL